MTPAETKADDSKRWDEATCWAWVEDCLRWRGEVLHGNHCHWCVDWDGLPIDDTTPEWSDCLLSAPWPPNQETTP